MAQRQKAKLKRKGPKNTDKEQSERFKETARKLSIEESGVKFEKAIVKVLAKRERRS